MGAAKPPSPKVGGASSPTSSTKSAGGARKARPHGKKGGASSSTACSKQAGAPSNNSNQSGNAYAAAYTSRGVVVALFVILYLCLALTFSIQVFVSPSKLSGLGGLATQTIVHQVYAGASTPQSAVTTTTTTTTATTRTTTTSATAKSDDKSSNNNNNNNRFQLDPSTIQSLHGLTEQQIRELLGNEIQIQLRDQQGRIIQTTAIVDVQTTTATIISNNRHNDVTVNHDVFDEIATYHCPTATTTTTTITVVHAPQHVNDVVLLNAGRYLSPDHFNQTRRAAIVKDRYREKVFLDLCLQARRQGQGITSITALDVPASIAPHRLLAILQMLHQRHHIQRLPVAALITPGRSADTVVDWLLYGDDDDVGMLQHQIAERWIPVASDRVLELDTYDEEEEDGSFDDEITKNASAPLRNGVLDLVRGWPVLAVYGSDDILARQGAELLERRLQAQTIAMAGGDDCHERATETFAVAVMDYLSKQIKSSSSSSSPSSPVRRATATTTSSTMTTPSTTAIPTTKTITNNGQHQFAIQFKTL